jgi:hypothetical protein
VCPAPQAMSSSQRSLHHRGRAAVSPDETKLAVTNLFDGVDLYSLIDQSRLHSVSVDMKENVSVAVTFINNNTIVFGGGSGFAYIAEGTPLAVKRTLGHSGVFHLLRLFRGSDLTEQRVISSRLW